MTELAKLEDYWARAVFEADDRADLRERAGWLRVALNLAMADDGWLSLG